MTPTKNVQIATLISAVVGLVAWVFDMGADGVTVPPEAIGWFTTLIVGAIAYAQRSAKVTAGAMATAAVGLVVWAMGRAGVEVPPDAMAYLNTMFLFVFAWITTEFADAEPGEDLIQ